jgi:hypothetical protein
MKTKYINSKKKWSAFTTVNGLDIQEYGNTEKEAMNRLTDRIASSNFLLDGLKLPK